MRRSAQQAGYGGRSPERNNRGDVEGGQAGRRVMPADLIDDFIDWLGVEFDQSRSRLNLVGVYFSEDLSFERSVCTPRRRHARSHGCSGSANSRCRGSQFAARIGSDARPNKRPGRCTRLTERIGRAVINSCLKG